MPRLVIGLLLLAASAIAESEMSKSLDRSVDPCEDFSEYACRAWFVQNPMPADRIRWGQYDQLRDRTQGALRELLEAAAARPRDAVDRKIGNYYGACIDEAAIDQLGLHPIKPELDRIEALAKREDLPEVIARLHLAQVNALFAFNASPDYKNSALMIADLDQGGLTLPDRDFYLKPDARYVTLRGKYLEYVEQVFGLLGYHDASTRAKAVLEFETALAAGALDRVSRRNPVNLYHIKTTPELQSMAPSFDWSRYFAAVGAPALQRLNVDVPAFVGGVERQVRETAISDWKNYLVWRYAATYADVLPSTLR